MKHIPLVQVCDFQGGSQPPKDQWIDHEEDGYIRMLQIRDFTQPDKDNVEFVRISKTIKTCKEDDILIGRYGASVGKILTGLSGAYNVAIIKTIPDTSKLSKRFLYHYLNSPYFQNFILSVGSRAAQAGFNKDDLRDAQIPDLSLDEQNNVVFQLDKINGLIDLRKDQLSKLDKLIKARFVELFGSQCHNEKNYPYGKIDDVAEIYLGLTHTPEYIETGVKFISAKNTSCDYLDLSDVKYISKEEYASAPAGAKPRKGDVLFSRVGSNLGHPVILDIDEELCTFVSLGYLRTKGRVTNLYLKHWMRDDFFAEQVRRKVVGGGQPNLNTGWLKEFRIIIPPMDLQEQFAAFVEQTDKSKLVIQQSLYKLETLKKALMQQYFG